MKYITVFFMCILALAVGFAVEDDLSMEGFFPGETKVFVKTEPIADLIVSVKNIISLLDSKSSAEITEQINTFKNKTGIDPLDENALRKAGLDTKRRIAVAYLPSEEPCVLLPVSNGETFGRAFVEIVLKMNDDPQKRDLYPAVSSYKNHKISQLGKDIFVVAVNDFFAIAYSGEQIRAIVDISLQNKNAALSQNPAYLSYLKQKNNDLKTVHTFIRGSYASTSSPGDVIASSMDFILLGASIEKNKLLFQLGVSFNKSDPIINAVLGMFSTGATNLALYDTDSQLYSFLALNLNSLDALPDTPSLSKLKSLYHIISAYVKETYGVDFKEDFSMYSKGVFNIMIGDIIKNENAIFMPMTDASKSLALSKKIQEHIKKEYEPKNLFGYENVGSFGKAAYYFGETGVKNYIYSDQRGFYVATSISLLNAAVKKPYIAAAGKPFGMKINDNMWGFSVIKKNTLW
ncbi:MAG: hypothetical protein FWG92_06390, partial [Leptospirales bacterium]|nr:hypothetical protein [Leptospirales bacterium]